MSLTEWFVGLVGGLWSKDSPESGYNDSTEEDIEDEDAVVEIEEPEPLELPMTKNKSTRPVSFDEFTGNKRTVDRLKIAIKAAQIEARPVPHILLFGYPGLGKTTLSNIIANELDAKLKIITGSAISGQDDIFRILYELRLWQNAGSYVVLFIDEIHDLKAKTAPETLWFPILEDFAFFHNLTDKTIELNGEEKLITGSPVTLPPFTIIGATTNAGDLSRPLRERFPITCSLTHYTADDLLKIIQRYSDKIDYPIEDSAAQILSHRARGTPRVCISHLLGCKDRALVADTNEITAQIVQDEMEARGIDRYGLTDEDRHILTILHETGKPIGIQRLAAACRIDKTQILEMHEGFLTELGFLSGSSRGRQITEKGKAYLLQRIVDKKEGE